MKRVYLVAVIGVATCALTFGLGWHMGSASPVTPPPHGQEVRGPVHMPASLMPSIEERTAQDFMDYFGLPESDAPAQLGSFVVAGADKAIADFAASWREPNPLRGIPEDIADEEANLGQRLWYLVRQYDDRGRNTASSIKAKLEDASLSAGVRDVLFGLLMEMRPREEIAYFRQQSRSESDPWLRSISLHYLASNRVHDALASEVKNALSAKMAASRFRSLGSIRAFFGKDVEEHVPSVHWQVLDQDRPDEAELGLLAEDVRNWWDKHSSDYEK